MRQYKWRMVEIAEVPEMEEKPGKPSKREQKLQYLQERKRLREELIRRSANPDVPYPRHLQERVRKVFPKNYFKHGITNDHDDRRGLKEIGNPITLQSAERDLPIQTPGVSYHIRRLREIDVLRTRNESSSEDDDKEGKIVPCL